MYSNSICVCVCVCVCVPMCVCMCRYPITKGFAITIRGVNSVCLSTLSGPIYQLRYVIVLFNRSKTANETRY